MKFLLSFLLCFVPTTVLASKSIMLGDLEMLMRSRTPSDMNEVLLDLMTVTVTFLDKSFQQHFPPADFASDQDFDKISLAVNSYGMELSDNGGYLARASFKVRAFFQDAATPTQQDALEVSKSTFHDNNQEFLQELMSSTDPFLADLSYAVVKVNGENVNVGSDKDTSSGVDSENWWERNWVLGVMAGAAAFFVVVCICFLCIMCTPLEDNDVAPSVKASKSSSQQTNQTSSDSRDSRSPSPARSITSQDSSIFTYNPRSNKSTCSSVFTYGNQASSKSQATTTFFGGSNSVFTSNTGLELDVEAWQKESTVQKDNSLFGGHDISAIESKKDLSLIEECSEDGEETPKQQGHAKRHLTEYSLSELERGDQRRRALSRSRRASRKAEPDTPSAPDYVIDDLNDLSHQFNHYRQSR